MGTKYKFVVWLVLGVCLQGFCVNANSVEPVNDGDAVDEPEITVINANQVCKPNDVRMEDCNRCKCSPNGIGWFCTRLVCPPKTTTTEKITIDNDNAVDAVAAEVVKREVTTPKMDIFSPIFKCTPGEEFENIDGCTCTCLNSGKTAFCDRDDCKPTLAQVTGKHGHHRHIRAVGTVDQCTPGESFLDDEGCNMCRCGSEGLRSRSACTEKLCLQRPRRSNSDRCKPGDNYKHADGCNDCRCGPDGMKSRSLCTAKLCRRKRSDGDTCTPGETFRDADDCNNCLCGPDGLKSSAACTKKKCFKLEELQEKAEKCTPGETFLDADGCNTCTCGESGLKARAGCTLMLCNRKTREVEEEVNEADKCTPNESFMAPDGCNTCVCGPQGRRSRSACSLKFCQGATHGLVQIPDDFRPKRETEVKESETCTPGESFLDDQGCNTCWCGPEGLKARSACTLMLCIKRGESSVTNDARKKREEEELEPDKCIPNESFTAPDGCNTCVCGPQGLKARSACTLKFCQGATHGLVQLPDNFRPKRETEVTDSEKCTPGESFLDDEGCNTCHCGPEGLKSRSACTLKLCFKPGQIPERIQTLESARKKRSEEANDPDNCQPGESFMAADKCNECKCGALGKRSLSICTLKLCPESRKKRAADSCTPGETFLNKDGRSCICNDQGLKSPAVCHFALFQPRLKRSEDNSCEIGRSFPAPDGCNSCTCTNGIRSEAACTKLPCFLPRNKRDIKLPTKNPADAEFSCTVGEQFYHIDGCNSCICSAANKAACTVRECITTSQSAGNDAVLSQTDDMKCVPNSTFKSTDGCNTCFCAADGKSIGCTLMYCPPVTAPPPVGPMRPTITQPRN